MEELIELLEEIQPDISRKIFNTDENTRKYNGVLLSPNARSIFEIIL